MSLHFQSFIDKNNNDDDDNDDDDDDDEDNDDDDDDDDNNNEANWQKLKTSNSLLAPPYKTSNRNANSKTLV